METTAIQSKLDHIVSKLNSNKEIKGAVFCVYDTINQVTNLSAIGNLQDESPYYIASINKWFISALTLQLIHQNKLNWDTPIIEILGNRIAGIHQYKGKDYTSEITIKHVLSLTAGLPCYLNAKIVENKTLMQQLLKNNDIKFTIDEVINAVRQMPAKFKPNNIRAHYADTNHQLLAEIIEMITKKPIQDNLNLLFKELKMHHTWVITPDNAHKIPPIYYKNKLLQLPLFLSNTKTEIVSTAQDQLLFAKAFFEGHFYPKDQLSELYQWNAIFFPFQYGLGVQLFSIPRWLSPFYKSYPMIGHAGSTGAVTYWIPEKKYIITGTVNQQAKPQLAFQTMIKIINSLK